MLVLASRSPRRQEILRNAGIPFEVRPADIPEEPQPGETPEAHVRRLAREKAEAVPLGPGETILGADTIVTADGAILGKPTDAGDAHRMLRLLSGREHEVLTGVCLRDHAASRVAVASTRVRFVPITGEQIAAYVASGEPMDKAGAYAIQGLAGRYIDRIEGCYFNVVGLPLALVYGLLTDPGSV